MVYFSQLRDILPQNCIAYLKLKSFWATKSKYPKETLRRYLQEIGRISPRPLKQKLSNVFISWMDIFTCKCGWLLYSPCTLPCGHTVCKPCFSKSKFCAYCGEKRENFILNSTLDGLLEQWYPTHYQSSNLKGRALVFIKERQYEKAIELLDDAVDLVSNDFTALNLRSEAHHGLRNVKQCFRDATRSCAINEACGESFFRLGEAYAILNKLDDAVEAFNKCLELEPEDGDLNCRVVESLDRLLSMSPASEIAVSDDDSDEGGLEGKLHNVEGKQADSPCISNRFTATTSNDERISIHRDTQSSAGAVTEEEQLANEDSTSEPTRTSEILEETSGKNVEVGPSSRKKRQRELSPKALERKRGKIDCNQLPQLDDFECKLCFFLLFQPVTTACGHVFCKKCLERCIDYNPSCPICRRQLSCMESSGVGNITGVLEKAVEQLFPEESEERKRRHRTRMEMMARLVSIVSIHSYFTPANEGSFLTVLFSVAFLRNFDYRGKFAKGTKNDERFAGFWG